MSELTAGRYKGRIVKWAMGVSSKKETPQIAFTCALTGRVVPGGVEDCPPCERTVFRFFTAGAIEFTVKDLRSLGYDLATFDELDPDHPNSFDFEGKDVPLLLKYEEHEGTRREKWEFAFGGGGLEIKPMERKGFANLNAVFGAHLKAATKPKPAQRQHPAGGSGSDDEIAF